MIQTKLVGNTSLGGFAQKHQKNIKKILPYRRTCAIYSINSK